jgi:hypothetical protein
VIFAVTKEEQGSYDDLMRIPGGARSIGQGGKQGADDGHSFGETGGAAEIGRQFAGAR